MQAPHVRATVGRVVASVWACVVHVGGSTKGFRVSALGVANNERLATVFPSDRRLFTSKKNFLGLIDGPDV